MNKNVIITGVAQGIGNCLAKSYAKKGYRVFGIDVKKTDFEEKNIDFIQANLNNPEAITNAFEIIASKVNAVHILINNAGISKFHKNILDTTLEELNEIIGVNLRATFLCTKAFIPMNEGESYGRIINIASTRYHQNQADWEIYGTTKGGIVSFTNSMCVSLAHTPITVNAISPGWIQVSDYESLSKKDHEQHPSRRVGRPEDIAKACFFLTDEENDFINGMNLIIDGGMTKKMIYDNSNDFWENDESILP